jgi:hypothetical protein
MRKHVELGILKGSPEKFSAMAESLSFELRTAGFMPKHGGVFINTHNTIQSTPPGIELTLIVGDRTGIIGAYALQDDKIRIVLYADAQDLPVFKNFWGAITPELKRRGY